MDELRNDIPFSARFKLSLWKPIYRYMKPQRWRILFLVTMMLLAAGCQTLVPIFMSYAINNFVEAHTTQGMGLFVLVYLIAILLQSGTTVAFVRNCMVLEMSTAKDMKRDCFLHLQKLPLSFYNTTSVGWIIARVMSDTSRISGLVAWGSIDMIWNTFYLIGVIIAMFILNAKVALVIIAVIPVVVLMTVIFQPNLIKAKRQVRAANSRITTSINENVGGAKTSKTLVIEDKNSEEFNELSGDMRRHAVHSARLSAIYVPLITFLGSLAVASALTVSGDMVMRNLLDFGVMSAFIVYGISIIDPVTTIAAIFSEFLDVQVNIERVTTLMSKPYTIKDSPELEEKYGDAFSPKTENYPPIYGDIEFEDVWFRYPDAAEDDYVLENIQLKVPAGTTVAIVGETGAGKSTMVNLACRFFEPTKGRILIDGVDYRERTQHWLHSSLGYVQQSPHLFSGTVRDNIRYGKLDATDEEIEAAAKLVSADLVVSKLEKGYDTDVGEGGSRLSTGEKQLVSFARAVIANPPIFVLDEATSSIDTETEHLIQTAISKVLQGRTSFIIAHRLSTIRNADIILFVEGREIKEKGSHDELMALGGRYAQLYNAMRLPDESTGEK